MPGFNLRSSGLQHPQNVPYLNDGLERTEWSANDYFEFTGQYPKNYPHHFIEKEGSYFEGMVYNLDPRDHFTELKDLLDAYHFDEVIEKIKSWDGEFVFVHRDRSSKSMYIVNDSWGRLPVYYWQQGDQFIASRNISCITHFAQPKYDPLHLSMNLLLGTDLGTNTIWKHVQRMPPRSILHIHGDGHISLYEYFHLETVDGNKTLSEAVPAIERQFHTALNNRLERLKNPSVSLRDGWEARLIAAEVNKLGADVPFIRYIQKGKTENLDQIPSQDVTQQLKLKNQEVFEIHTPELEEIEQFLKYNQSINYASVHYMFPHYRELVAKDQTSITSIGGDLFFADLSPSKTIRSVKELMRYVLRNHALCSLETAAKLTGISVIELEENIMWHLNAYPFSSYNEKYVYFLIRELAINCEFDEEDRKRQFVWNTTPFYTSSLIETCLSIPQSSKKDGALHLNLLKETSTNQQSRMKRSKQMKDQQKINTFLFSDALQGLMQNHEGTLQLKAIKKYQHPIFYWKLFALLFAMK